MLLCSIFLDLNLHFCLQACGQTSQRVRLATQLLSRTVGTAITQYLPQRRVQAQVVLAADAWFDTLNSRVPFTNRLQRCGYGATAEAKVAQDQALSTMEEMVLSMRKSTPRHPGGQNAMLKFQHGMLRSTSSLRGLYGDLKEAVPQLKYILTTRLNQDCLENCFSQVTGSDQKLFQGTFSSQGEGMVILFHEGGE